MIIKPARIGVFCHMFHSELFGEVADHLANIPYPYDLYLSTSTVDDWRTLRQMFPRANVAIVPNRGRDLAPKFITFGSLHHLHDIVLHLHTKKSIPGWRHHIYQHLLGSPAVVSEIVNAFDLNPRLGIIAGEHYPPISAWVRWTDNRPHAETIAARMSVELTDDIEFPSGSMFWARPAALQPIFDLRLSYNDFPPEPIPPDGTFAHALERMIFLSAIKAGYSWSIMSLESGTPLLSAPCDAHIRPDWTPPPFPEGEAPREDQPAARETVPALARLSRL